MIYLQVHLDQEWFGNTVREYLLVLAAIVCVFLVLQLVKRWLLKAVEKYTSKTESRYDDVVVSTIEKFVIPYLYLAINFNIVRQLQLPARLDRIMDVALTVITVIFAARLINHMIHVSLKNYMERRDEGPSRLRQLSGILIVIKALIWAIGILFFLDNVGYDVTTVIAGLGVGGIAIALAAQNILSDLFSYFVIFFDKPFEIGDFIVVNDKMGTVERIGIKTSHVRGTTGEQLVMPNADLVKSTIHNMKRLQRRTVVFKLTVGPGAAVEQLRAIPAMIREAILANELTAVDRSHLHSFSEAGFHFEAVYFIHTPDYVKYMDINQSVHLRVLQQVRDHGMDIAHPTQKFIIQSDDKGMETEERSVGEERPAGDKH